MYYNINDIRDLSTKILEIRTNSRLIHVQRNRKRYWIKNYFKKLDNCPRPCFVEDIGVKLVDWEIKVFEKITEIVFEE